MQEIYSRYRIDTYGIEFNRQGCSVPRNVPVPPLTESIPSIGISTSLATAFSTAINVARSPALRLPFGPPITDCQVRCLKSNVTMTCDFETPVTNADVFCAVVSVAFP